MKGLYYLLPIIIILLVIVIISTKRYENFEWSKLETNSGKNEPCVHCPDCGNIGSEYNKIKKEYDELVKKNDECNTNFTEAKDIIIPLLKSIISDQQQKLNLLASELDADKLKINTLTTNLKNMQTKYVNAQTTVNTDAVKMANLQAQLNGYQKNMETKSQNSTKNFLSRIGL